MTFIKSFISLIFVISILKPLEFNLLINEYNIGISIDDSSSIDANRLLKYINLFFIC